MAHFAKLNEENVVIDVIVISNDKLLDSNNQEQEALGLDFIENVLILPGPWKQTSYNGSFRKNYAGIGYVYDESRDAFIPPQPEEECTFNEQTCRWELPPKAEEGI